MKMLKASFNCSLSPFEPLTLAEVAEAIVVNREEQHFDPNDRLIEPVDILEICSSLVTLSEFGVSRDRELRFAHYSVKEYLVSTRISDMPSSYFRISDSECTDFCCGSLSYISTLFQPARFLAK